MNAERFRDSLSPSHEPIRQVSDLDTNILLLNHSHSVLLEDRRNIVRKVPKLASLAVRFEGETILTRAGSSEDIPIIEDTEAGENLDASRTRLWTPSTREFLGKLTEERDLCPLPYTLS